MWRVLDLMMDGRRRLWMAKELASALGYKQTSIYYHVDLLDATGLISVDRISVINGIAERHYSAAQAGICFHLGASPNCHR
jgi:hypothetical protein